MNSPFQALTRDFYEPNAARVARALLGHYLLRRTESEILGGIIVETEAYLADDPACHGFRGETRRNRAMFGPPGHAYVYFIYGNHFCFNTVCSPPGVAEAVLVRAIEPLYGLESMQAARNGLEVKNLTNGPGKLCAALTISREHDHTDLCDTRSPVFIAWNPAAKSERARHGPIKETGRIGLSKAADRLLRFYLSGSAYVSRKGRDAPQI
jgi:DNA-3-methyladenine glycosylase